MTTTPPSITALPAAPDPNDRSTFNARAYPWSAALPTFGTQVSAVGANVKANADEVIAATDAVIAAGLSTAAANAATASAAASAATTQAGIATTKAGEANTSAIAAAASAASISGGPVTSVNGRTGVITGVQDALVSGTSIKTINSSSILGAGDLALGSSLLRSARTANAVLGTADKGKLIDITSGTFTQTFTAAATLGDGWYCYLKNSGTSDITLDPNAAELIDGLTSYVMYPGECRLVQCDGAAVRTVVLNSFYKVFTASGSYVNPPGYAAIEGIIWSGGGGGGSTGGGGGGGAFPINVSGLSGGSSTTITVGAGGASASDGGDSSFGTLITVKGGKGYLNSGYGGSVVVNGEQSLSTIGGGFSSPRGTSEDSIYAGGQSGKDTAGYEGRSSIYGGGGGSRPAQSAVSGKSVFGGNSATSTTAAIAPGGGGCGTTNTSGARGEIRIWGII